MDTKVNKLFFQGPEGSLPLSQESYIFAIPVLCGNKQESFLSIIQVVFCS